MIDNGTPLPEFIEQLRDTSRLTGRIQGHHQAVKSFGKALDLIGKQIDNGVITTASQAQLIMLNELISIAENYNPEPLPFEPTKKEEL